MLVRPPLAADRDHVERYGWRGVPDTMAAQEEHEALHGGTIAGAGLDVYEHEPEVTESLLALENVVLAPHLGSATRDTRVAMGMLCVSALRAVLLEGRTPCNVVV